LKRQDRTTKERAVEQRDEKVRADGGALKEKTRRRETSKTNCAMISLYHFYVADVGREDFRGYTAGQGKRWSM